MKQVLRQKIRLFSVFLLALVIASEPIEAVANLFPGFSVMHFDDVEDASEETDDDFRVSVKSIQRVKKSRISPQRPQPSDRALHYFRKNSLVPEKTGDAAALISFIHFHSGDSFSNTL